MIQTRKHYSLAAVKTDTYKQDLKNRVTQVKEPETDDQIYIERKRMQLLGYLRTVS